LNYLEIKNKTQPGHEPQTGTLIRFNRKSVTVITDNGGPLERGPGAD